MISTFFALVWIGGVGPAYRKLRDKGSGRLWSVLEAVFWPNTVGEYFVRNYLKARSE
jgi:hypothetical protein